MDLATPTPKTRLKYCRSLCEEAYDIDKDGICYGGRVAKPPAIRGFRV